jgi:hypothetical protein
MLIDKKAPHQREGLFLRKCSPIKKRFLPVTVCKRLDEKFAKVFLPTSDVRGDSEENL